MSERGDDVLTEWWDIKTIGCLYHVPMFDKSLGRQRQEEAKVYTRFGEVMRVSEGGQGGEDILAELRDIQMSGHCICVQRG